MALPKGRIKGKTRLRKKMIAGLKNDEFSRMSPTKLRQRLKSGFYDDSDDVSSMSASGDR